ncbi:hypothetical protein C9374_014113 [Naegleria lovaniensis]|uniref:Uncharacterized protein n=1 Tax=Naegleria lovaniensis TaxID=51637 RepID=A0AA88H010_NAELO|nr:uncharacterized protein C9374_014113 [Naegleria lovaniensis]KAG2389553.1 hypothetical protein C9374_014113 [Naegleria lovaniensis]
MTSFMDAPLLDFSVGNNNPYNTNTNINQKSSSSSPTFSTQVELQILEKAKQIDQIKLQLIEHRFNTKVIIDDEYRSFLKNQIGQLHVLESQIAQLRLDDHNEFINSLKLDELNSRVTSPVKKNLVEPAVAKVDALTVKSFLSKTEKNNAMRRWNKAINAVRGVSKFSQTYENARIKKAEEILRNPISAQMKNEILELRKSLVILNNKKKLTPDQEMLKEKLVEELKELDKRYHDQFSQE